VSEPTTFDESDWRELTGYHKKALRIFSRIAIGFEPLAKAAGVAQKSMDALMAMGLAVEGEPGLHGRTFKVTKKGWLAVE
jgi:hypothetical protein